MTALTYHTVPGCRFCGQSLRTVLNLGETPIANALCTTQEEALAAPRFPLELMVCRARDCGLYQLSVAVDPEVLFPPGYTYATPDNPELTAHYRTTLDWLRPMLTHGSVCVEIGSNNGRFLANVQMQNCIGVEPSSVKAVPGTNTIRAFFTEELVEKGVLAEQMRALPRLPPSTGADLIVARHCLAHIDDVHDVMRGVEKLLGHRGVLYIENAYALDTLMGGQFDQIYHEHLSYFTLTALEWLLDQHGMKVLDVRLSRVHGGSIMVAAVREGHPASASGAVGMLGLAERTDPLGLERRFLDQACLRIGVTRSAGLAPFLRTAVLGRTPTLDAWGAAAKAVTRFAASMLTHEHIRQCYDDSPLKQGKFLPGSGIPIVPCPEKLDADAVILTAWNYERTFRARYPSYTGTVIIP